MEPLLNILPIIQITLAVVLTVAILLQQRGAGLGGAFGGADGGVHYERRGFERTLFKATGVVAVLFVLSVMLSFLKETPSPLTDIIDTATTSADNLDGILELNPDDITVELGNGEDIDGLEITPIIDTAKTNPVTETDSATPESE